MLKITFIKEQPFFWNYIISRITLYNWGNVKQGAPVYTLFKNWISNQIKNNTSVQGWNKLHSEYSPKFSKIVVLQISGFVFPQVKLQ